MGDLRLFLPRSRTELRTFVALSVTAGVCEELLYRGYLIGYLGALGGPILAVAVSSAVFGLAHGGYGASTAASAALLGLLFAGLYLLTGALWVPRVLHAGFDVATGLTARLVHREPDVRDGAESESASPR